MTCTARSRTTSSSSEGRTLSLRTAGALSVAGLLVALGALTGCADRSDEQRVHTLATFDSVLMELGGTAPANLERPQRWRMISSIWAGLPPTNFDPEQLPEPDSRGAGLVQSYCTQCHWLPAPQMHSAEEWPLLVRRMILRARTITKRMGGPVTRRLVANERLLEGMAITAVPSSEDQDSLIAYLTEHALPTADPRDLPPGEGRQAFLDACTRCHDTPSPAAHAPEEWDGVVERMEANVQLIGVEEMGEPEKQRVVRYLESAAGGAGDGGG